MSSMHIKHSRHYRNLSWTAVSQSIMALGCLMQFSKTASEIKTNILQYKILPIYTYMYIHICRYILCCKVWLYPSAMFYRYIFKGSTQFLVNCYYYLESRYCLIFRDKSIWNLEKFWDLVEAHTWVSYFIWYFYWHFAFKCITCCQDVQAWIKWCSLSQSSEAAPCKTSFKAHLASGSPPHSWS